MDPADTHPNLAGAKPEPTNPWLRGLFMLIFLVAFAIGQSLLALTAITQKNPISSWCFLGCPSLYG
jgi:hypothetical protein